MKDIENGAKKPHIPEMSSTAGTDTPDSYVYIKLVSVPEAATGDETYNDSLVVDIDADCTECIAWVKANLNIDLNNIDL